MNGIDQVFNWYRLAARKFILMIFPLITFGLIFLFSFCLIAIIGLGIYWLIDIFHLYNFGREEYPISAFFLLFIVIISSAWYALCALIASSVFITKQERNWNLFKTSKAIWKFKWALLVILVIVSGILYLTFFVKGELPNFLHPTRLQALSLEFAISGISFYLLLPLMTFCIPLMLNENYNLLSALRMSMKLFYSSKVTAFCAFFLIAIAITSLDNDLGFYVTFPTGASFWLLPFPISNPLIITTPDSPIILILLIPLTLMYFALYGIVFNSLLKLLKSKA